MSITQMIYVFDNAKEKKKINTNRKRIPSCDILQDSQKHLIGYQLSCSYHVGRYLQCKLGSVYKVSGLRRSTLHSMQSAVLVFEEYSVSDLEGDMTTPNSKIEIYCRPGFKGLKYTFENETRHMPKGCVINLSKASIKIYGNAKWRISGSGKSIEFEKGVYLRLDRESGGVRYIESLQPIRPEPPQIPSSQIYKDPWAAVGGWFLGPKAENMDFFCEHAEKAFRMHADFRNMYFPTDPIVVGRELKSNEACEEEKRQTEKELTDMCIELQGSIPFYNPRYQAHQVGDVTMQGFLGYLAGILYNQNNQTTELSSVTTSMELEVGLQLCHMIGYGKTGTPVPWGHITSGGTVANLEALRFSRNAKFYPLTVREGLKDPRLAAAANFKVYVPGLGREKKLKECTNWECLNLDMDTILSLSKKVTEMAGVSDSEFSAVVDPLDIPSLGFAELIKKFGLTSIPKVLAPMSKHYSWSKAVSVLGIGDNNMVGVPYNSKGRMSITELKKKLDICLTNKDPVISVVVVVGSTETSAVDNVDKVIKLRAEYRSKGLTFAINADGAWGGYFCSMLHEPDPNNAGRRGSDIVPSFPVNPHTMKQLEVLKDVETVTADPHKTGFCPYPAGALCYRDTRMKELVAKTASYLLEAKDTPEVGFWGIEGSKPGAAATGVLLSHRVIGLDKYGIGRILGQCEFGTKLLYCVLLTLAQDGDKFVCVPLKPLPISMNLEKKKKFIREHILGKSNQELLSDSAVMEFLTEIGPDMLITAFGINTNNNRDISKCNNIIAQILERCSNTSDFYDVRRVEVFFCASQFPPELYGKAESQFKKRLMLPEYDTTPLSFLMNTNTNPWTSLNNGPSVFGKALRQAVLNAVGEVFDTPTKHFFVSTSLITPDGDVFADYMPQFNIPEYQYHVVTKFHFINEDAINTIRQLQDSVKQTPSNVPIVFGCESNEVLDNFLRDGMKHSRKFSVWVGLPSSENPPQIKHLDVVVIDTPLDNHFDKALKSYPEKMTYFLYGDENGTYLSHTLSKCPDFQQVVKLDREPYGVSQEILQLGIQITIPQLSGIPPQDSTGMIIDPLVDDKYFIEYRSYDSRIMSSTMFLCSDSAKVYFDSKYINQNCSKSIDNANLNE